MIISLDLDMVTRLTVPMICQMANAKYAATLTHPLESSMFNEWNPQLGHHLGISKDEFFQFAWLNKDVFINSSPMPHCHSVIRNWRNEGHKVIINTANPFPDVTYKWLEHWHIDVDDVIHTKNKANVKFDVHIDDSPKVLHALHDAGREVIRFWFYWNDHLNGQYPVVRSWIELQSLMMQYELA